MEPENPNPNVKRYCTYCGCEMTKGRDGKFFCPKCGYKPDADVQKQSSEKDEQQKKGLDPDTKSLIIKVVIWAILAGVALYMVKIMIDMVSAF